MKSNTLFIEIADIKIIQSIRAPISEVFHAITVARMVDEWGGGPARIQAKVNGKYSLWDGEMHGTIKEIEFPRKLIHTFRELRWEDNYLDSLVTWQFREISRGTELSLCHTGLPTRKIRESHNEGWGEYYLGPLKAYLEYRHR